MLFLAPSFLKKLFLSTIVLSSVFIWSGCANKTETTATTSAAKTTIGGVVFQDDQFFKLIEFGMKDAAKKNGAYISVENSSSAPDKEISIVDTFIAKKVNAIVISPLSIKASAEALKRAKDAGIKIVTYNTTVEGDIPICNIESNQMDLGSSTGKAAAKYIQEKLGGKAKLALLEFKSQAPEQSAARVKGFKDEITKLPGVKIVSEQDAWLAPDATDKVESILTAHPDINMIWAANEGGTVGATQAVKNANKSGKVVVFGTDMSDQLAGFLEEKENVLQAVTGQKPLDIGSMSVEMAIKAIKGEQVEKNVSLPGVLFTREKIDEVKDYQKKLQEMSKR